MISYNKQFLLKAMIISLILLIVSIGNLTIQFNIIDNEYDTEQNILGDYDEEKLLLRNAASSNDNDNVHQSEIVERANNEYNNENDEDDDTHDRYLPLLKSANNLKLELNQTKSSIEPIQIVHRATSGLGHRLQWMTSMHHFTKIMNLTNGLFNKWGWECHYNKNNEHDEDGS